MHAPCSTRHCCLEAQEQHAPSITAFMLHAAISIEGQCRACLLWHILWGVVHSIHGVDLCKVH